jgi:hypothetical protein
MRVRCCASNNLPRYAGYSPHRAGGYIRDNSQNSHGQLNCAGAMFLSNSRAGKALCLPVDYAACKAKMPCSGTVLRRTPRVPFIALEILFGSDSFILAVVTPPRTPATRVRFNCSQAGK